MFELLRYLDSLRKSPGNRIDEPYILKILRSGDGKSVASNLSSKEKTIFSSMKDAASQEEWMGIEEIIRSFNFNWDQRNAVHGELEALLCDGQFKAADELISRMPGALVIESQYYKLKGQHAQKCKFITALKTNDLDKAYEMFRLQCNSDMAPFFNKMRTEAVARIQEKIDCLVIEKNWVDANFLFDKYQTYLSADSFEEITCNHMERLQAELVNEIEHLANANNTASLESIYKLKYLKIPRREFLPIYHCAVISSIANLMDSKDFKRAENIYSKNMHSISYEQYMELKHDYAVRHIENLLINHDVIGSEGVYEQCTDIITETDYRKLKSDYEVRTISEVLSHKGIDAGAEYYLLECKVVAFDAYKSIALRHSNKTDNNYLSRNVLSSDTYESFVLRILGGFVEKIMFDRADEIYLTHKDVISQSDYAVLKQDHLMGYLETQVELLPESFNQIKDLCFRHKTLLPSGTFEKFQDLYKISSQIKECIQNYEKLSDVYQGVKPQRDKQKELLSSLKTYFKNHREWFSEDRVNKINKIKETIRVYDEQNHQLNISEAPPMKLDDSVFFHQEDYYISTFITNITKKSDVDHPTNGDVYKVRDAAGEVREVLAKDLVVCGSFIGSNKDYKSHCYNCKAEINGRIQIMCKACKLFICSKCGACMCGYSKY